MSITRNIALFLFIYLGMVNLSNAQRSKTPNFPEGVIKYKIEVEGMSEVEKLTNNVSIDVSFKQQNAKIDFAMMGGLVSMQFINNQSKNLKTVLMNIPTFYEKTAVEFDENSDFMQELLKAQKTNTAPIKTTEIRYNKRKKKRIAKYPCHLAEMDVEGQAIKFYVTEKLRPSTSISDKNEGFNTLKGFPLAIEMDIKGMAIKITAVDVIKKNVESTDFDIPTSYEMKTLDEFVEDVKAKTKGMGQSGIGL